MWWVSNRLRMRNCNWTNHCHWWLYRDTVLRVVTGRIAARWLYGIARWRSKCRVRTVWVGQCLRVSLDFAVSRNNYVLSRGEFFHVGSWIFVLQGDTISSWLVVLLSQYVQALLLGFVSLGLIVPGVGICVWFGRRGDCIVALSDVEVVCRSIRHGKIGNLQRLTYSAHVMKLKKG